MKTQKKTPNPCGKSCAGAQVFKRPADVFTPSSLRKARPPHTIGCSQPFVRGAMQLSARPAADPGSLPD